jgi:hypothetical protein
LSFSAAVELIDGFDMFPVEMYTTTASFIEELEEFRVREILSDPPSLVSVISDHPMVPPNPAMPFPVYVETWTWAVAQDPHAERRSAVSSGRRLGSRIVHEDVAKMLCDGLPVALAASHGVVMGQNEHGRSFMNINTREGRLAVTVPLTHLLSGQSSRGSCATLSRFLLRKPRDTGPSICF